MDILSMLSTKEILNSFETVLLVFKRNNNQCNLYVLHTFCFIAYNRSIWFILGIG